MRNTTLITAFLVLACALVSRAQVTQSINSANMKITQEQQSRQKEKTSASATTVEVDTTTRYFAFIDSAAAAIDNKQWTEAENFIRQAIAEEPTNANNSLLISNLATIQRYQGKLVEAIKNYTLALDMTPNAVTLLLNRAACFVESGNVEAAVADYARVRQLDPTDEESRYNLAIIKMQTGDFSEAQKCIDEILKYHPNSLIATEALAIMNKTQGNHAKAVEYFSEIITSRPTAETLAHRADCYLVLKRLNDASDDIRNALEMNPDDGYLYLLRAKLNKLRFNYEDEQRDRQLAIKHGVSQETIEAMLGK